MSRGLDVDDVGIVINYDVPLFIKSYVHRFVLWQTESSPIIRVGRTARAGRQGTTYTIARSEEIKHFKEILSKAENSAQTKINPDTAKISAWMNDYKNALKQLQIQLAKEQGQLSAIRERGKKGNIRLATENPGDQQLVAHLLRSQAARLFFPQ